MLIRVPETPRLLTASIEVSELARTLTLDFSLRLPASETLSAVSTDDQGTGIVHAASVDGTLCTIELLGTSAGTSVPVEVVVTGSAGSSRRCAVMVTVVDPAAEVAPVVVTPEAVKRKGTWTEESVVSVNDLWLYDGAWWLALTASIAVTPTEGTSWTQFAAQGDVGPQGETGPTGATGAACSLTVGTVTTGAAGSAASATISGTAPNQTLALTIPRGDAGSNVLTGTFAARPAPATVPGNYYYATDKKITWQSDGTRWRCHYMHQSTTVYVDPLLGTDAAGYGYGTGASAFRSIGYAIGEIPSCGGPNGFFVTIQLADGTYTENGIINCPGSEFAKIVGNISSPGLVEWRPGTNNPCLNIATPLAALRGITFFDPLVVAPTQYLLTVSSRGAILTGPSTLIFLGGSRGVLVSAPSSYVVLSGCAFVNQTSYAFRCSARGGWIDLTGSTFSQEQTRQAIAIVAGDGSFVVWGGSGALINNYSIALQSDTGGYIRVATGHSGISNCTTQSSPAAGTVGNANSYIYYTV